MKDEDETDKEAPTQCILCASTALRMPQPGAKKCSWFQWGCQKCDALTCGNCGGSFATQECSVCFNKRLAQINVNF